LNSRTRYGPVPTYPPPVVELVERCLGLEVWLFEKVRWERRVGEQGVGVDVGLLPADQDGAFVGRLDPLDERRRFGLELGQVALHAQSEREVAGADRGAIVPGGALSDLPGRLHAAVREDVPQAVVG
jgi:hypothetical protein